MADTPLKTAALVYDFDGTLAKGNLPEHSLFAKLGVTDHQAFWDANRSRAAKHDADEVLSYMRALMDEARKRAFRLTRDALKAEGAAVPFFEGVPDWFSRIDSHARAEGFDLEHYMISSGLLEIIEGCSIYPAFKKVFASSYEYDDSGEACWPAVAINYTTKTQFLFRINKGILNSHDNRRINRWQPKNERPVPFTRMIFIGDGDTDIPSMKMVRYQGGQAVAVFDPAEFGKPTSQDKMKHLIAEERVDYVTPADYRAGSQLELTIRGILGRIKTKGEARRRFIE